MAAAEAAGVGQPKLLIVVVLLLMPLLMLMLVVAVVSCAGFVLPKLNVELANELLLMGLLPKVSIVVGVRLLLLLLGLTLLLPLVKLPKEPKGEVGNVGGMP